MDAVTIEQVADALRQLAAWSPKPEQAKQAAQTMLDDYALLKSQYANKPKNACFSSLVPILCLPVEKVLFSTKFLRYAAEKTSLPVVGFPGRRLAVSRSGTSSRAIVATGGPGETLKIEQYWGNQLKYLLLHLIVTGSNARARVLSSPQNNSVMRFHR